MSTNKQISPVANQLEIIDIFLFSVSARGRRDFNPTERTETELLSAHRFRVEETATNQVRTPISDPSNHIRVIRFFVDAQAMILKKGSEAQADEWNEEEALASFKHLFAADYRWLGAEAPEPEQLGSFANNVIYHVWPYWREALHADCARMRLPPATLPMMKTMSFPATVTPSAQTAEAEK